MSADGDSHLAALTGGYHAAFVVGAIFAVSAVAIGVSLLRTATAGRRGARGRGDRAAHACRGRRLNRTIAGTELSVFPLCLGSNVFGWTVDERAAFAVLDAYAAAGGNFVDTADSYAAWGEGNSGGESETIIGRWMAARGNRDDIVVATKVGKMPGLGGLAPATIRRAAEDSLARLGSDRIDLYYAHLDDEDTPLEDTLAAFGELIDEGKVRCIAASNYGAPRLAEALAVARANDLPEYVAVQPHYNLVHRGDYEGELADLCVREGLGSIPYPGLAGGFLTGKYRPGGRETGSPRAAGARSHLDDRGLARAGCARRGRREPRHHGRRRRARVGRRAARRGRADRQRSHARAARRAAADGRSRARRERARAPHGRRRVRTGLRLGSVRNAPWADRSPGRGCRAAESS